MMKRIISLLLVFALCITVIPTTVLAQETDLRYTQDQMDTIVHKYEYNEDMLNALFCTDAAIGYWGMANEIKQNDVLSWALDMSSKLIGEYPEKQDYAEMLANLITMQSGELAEQIETQSRFDDLKDIGDYAWDVIDIAGTFVDANGLLETIGPIVDTTTGGAELIAENIEQVKFYELTILDYSQNHLFLTAISMYAENQDLRDVAKSLISANKQLLEKRLDYLVNELESVAEFEAEFFIENLSFELLKSADLYTTDENVKFFVDCSSDLVDAVGVLFAAGEFAFKITMLAGDIGFGTSDVYNRYQEMKTVADIAGALVKANEAISIPSETNQAKLEVIQEKCNLYKALVVTHARGEYLLYQLLMNDAGALSDIRWIIEYFKNPEDTTDAWYEGQIDVLTKYCDILDNMFVVSSMLDLDNLVTDAYVRDCTSMIDGGYGMTGMYRIPQINMAYGDVEKINSEIYDTFYPIIEDSISAMQEYGYPSRSGEVEYRWAVNGDILSLVISNFGHPTMTGNYYFTIYNISISTGLLVSDAEVISQAGFSPEDYKQRVKEVLGSRFWGSWDPTNENFEQASFVEFFNDALRKTLSDDNIAKAQPYINEEGQLCITASIYALAGGETYNDDLNMIDFEFLDYYADEATLLSTASNYDGPSDSTDYPASDFSADAVYRIGDGFQFGFYEQDGNTKNGTEPIQWRVLDSEQGKILVISVKAIECKQFHSKDKIVTWENSDLRQWLNNDFYQTAFSESERKSILLSNVSSESNPENNIDPGANTTDYIYIPSISEMQQYFKSNSDRKCVATKYAIGKGAYAPKDQNYCTWWLLRNPGEAGDKVANVNTDGRIDYIGSRVESVNGAVRVMMWLELKESATPDETKPTESHDQTHKTGDYTIDDIKTNGYGFYIMYDDGTFDRYYSGSVLVWEGPRPMTYGADYIPESLIISSSRDDINRERIKKGKLVLVCSETNRIEYSLTPVEFSGNALSTTVEGKTAAMFLTKTSVNHWTSGRNIGWFGGGMYTIKIDDVPISEWTADLESTNNRGYLPLARGQEMQISIAYGATMETFDCVVNLSYYFQNHDIEYDLILNATSDGYAIIDLSNVPSGEYLIHYSWWNTESRARSVLATHVVVE